MLIVVHGVGNHTEESFAKEVTNTLGVALANYINKPDGIDNSAFLSQNVDVKCIAYNDIFQHIFDRHNAVKNSMSSLAKVDFSNLVTKVLEIQASLGEENFLTTHVFDALLYQSFIKDAIDCAVAVKLAELLRLAYNNFQTDIHILGHSLGTAVIHNVLQKAFHGALDISLVDSNVRNDDVFEGHAEKFIYLNAHCKFDSVTTVSNCSPWFQHAISPVESGVVRPSVYGCCHYYIDIHHHLDPVCAINKFDTHSWSETERGLYHKIAFSDVASLKDIDPTLSSESFTISDIHSIQHYLSYPECHAVLFDLIGITITDAKKDAAMEKWLANTIAGSFNNVIEQLRKVDISVDMQDGKPELHCDTQDVKDAWLKFVKFFKGE